MPSQFFQIYLVHIALGYQKFRILVKMDTKKIINLQKFKIHFLKTKNQTRLIIDYIINLFERQFLMI